MYKDVYDEIKNNMWDKKTNRAVSIITPAYNNKEELIRAMNSIKSQTFQDIEYIVINDGSPENLDDVVIPFLYSVTFPMIYVKKRNGGAHTSYNRGIQYARGKYLMMLDCDDELVENAIEVLINTWDAIKCDSKNYYQVVAQCVNEVGERVGQSFPENINSVTRRESIEMLDHTKGEHVSMDLVSVRKTFLCPEPDGVTHVSEDIIHKRFDKLYDSYFINDMLRVYHTEIANSISKTYNKKTLQTCYNSYWNTAYWLNNIGDYEHTLYQYLKSMFRFLVLKNVVIKLDKKKEKKRVRITGCMNNTFALLLSLPAYLASKVYIFTRTEN